MQVVSSLSILEAGVLVAAPILACGEVSMMRKTGVITYWLLSLLLVVGCAVACIANSTPPAFALRGMAVCCLISCSIIVGHWLIRTRMSTLKWMFVGIAIGMIINIFVFRGAYTEVEDMRSGGATGSYGGLFWLSHFSGLLQMLPLGWYMTTPIIYSAATPILMALFGVLSTVSGRSAALGYIGSFVFVLIGQKKIARMKLISRYFWLFFFAGVLGVFALKGLYQTAATSGWLGDESRIKYERQTKGDTSLKKLMLGGRIDSFVGLVACADKPIIGWGPWAIDDYGYYAKFLMEYGDAEDYANYVRFKNYVSMNGGVEDSKLIPVHSILTEFWCWYGISGLLFVLYSVYALVRFMRQDISVVPQWYYWLACGMVARLWDIGFSPFADRFGFPLVVVACIMSRAIRLGRLKMPQSYINEIVKAKKK